MQKSYYELEHEYKNGLMSPHEKSPYTMSKFMTVFSSKRKMKENSLFYKLNNPGFRH